MAGAGGSGHSRIENRSVGCGSGVRIRRNGKLPFGLNSWPMAGNESTPAACVTESQRQQWPTSRISRQNGERRLDRTQIAAFHDVEGRASLPGRKCALRISNSKPKSGDYISATRKLTLANSCNRPGPGTGDYSRSGLSRRYQSNLTYKVTTVLQQPRQCDSARARAKRSNGAEQFRARREHGRVFLRGLIGW